MATTSTTAFGAPLRKTTRTAIFLPPLFWTTHHLDLLRVSLISISQPRSQSLDYQLQRLQLAISSTGPKNLPNTVAQPDYLNVYWYWCNHGADIAANWLSELVMTVVDYIQKDMEFGSFVKRVENFGKSGPKLRFRFANTSTALRPEILLSTAKTNVPFLLFSTAAHRYSLREDLANTFRQATQSRKDIDAVASMKFEIDPFDVACLIAMAQEQAFQFRMSNLLEIPSKFTVYLMTPNPSTSASLHLYTAEIPQAYLDAMENLDTGLGEKLTISREVVQIPFTYVPADKLDEGTLVERLGGILERCHEFMRALQEEKDLYERKLAKVRFSRIVLPASPQRQNGGWI